MSKENAGKLIAGAVLALLLLSAGLVARRADLRPRTDDAFLLANVANIAPEVSGRIVALNIRDNQSVRAGDLLFVIDPEPYRLKVDAERARRELASATLARTEPLLGKGYVTEEQLDQTRSELESAQAAERVAQHDLDNTAVTAPFDGEITGLTISTGEYAATGHPLFTMIDTSRWYAVANFRETELAGMKPGTSATVYVMSHPGRALRGRVDSVGWGVTSEDASLESGLPKIPKTLNWVRLAQRFPVRILLDHPAADLMRIGASCVVVIRYEAGR